MSSLKRDLMIRGMGDMSYHMLYEELIEKDAASKNVNCGFTFCNHTVIYTNTQYRAMRSTGYVHNGRNRLIQSSPVQVK